VLLIVAFEAWEVPIQDANPMVPPHLFSSEAGAASGGSA